MLRVRPLSGCKHRHKKRPDQQRQGKAVFNIEIGGTGVLSTAALTCYAWWAFFMPMAVLTSCCQLGHASPYDSHHCVVLFSGRPQSGSRSVSPPPCASLVRYLVGCLIGYLVRYLAGGLLAASSAAQFATSQAASLTALLSCWLPRWLSRWLHRCMPRWLSVRSNRKGLGAPQDER